jgi:glc operon protein GlcG
MVATPASEWRCRRYSPTMADLIESKSVSLAAAESVATAARDAAKAAGYAMCICVTDPSGEPVVALRMDGAPRMSASIAANKAWTVASFSGMPTHIWWSAIENDPSLVHGLTQTPRLIVFGGGVPLMVAGQIVGALGVSGGTSEQDREIAEAAAATLA